MKKNAIVLFLLLAMPHLGYSATGETSAADLPTKDVPIGADTAIINNSESVNTVTGKLNTARTPLSALPISTRQQTALDLKANKAGAVLLWSEWANGSTFTMESPLVVYNGTLYRCTAPYAKTAGATPDSLTDNFEEAIGAVGVTSYNDLTDKPTIPSALGDLSEDATHRTVTDAEKTKLSNLSGTNTGDQNATSTPFTPNGTIAATTTQSAIEEVRNEATLPTLTEGQTIIGGIGGAPTAVDTDVFSAADISTAISLSGNSKYYGTDSGGTAGVYDLPAGGSMTWPSVAGIPYWTSGTSWAGSYALSTSVATPGSDAVIPTEQAVREAISAVSVSAPTVQADDPTAASADGWYAATGSGDIFYKSPAGLFTIAGVYAADPVTYGLTVDFVDVTGADKITLGGTDYSTDGTITGLSGATSFTVVPDTGRTGDCVGTGITGTGPDKSADMSADRSMTCTFAVVAAPNFVGAPGTTETFEASAGNFVTGQFAETDPQSIINTYSTTQYKNGTHSASLAFSGSEAGINHLRADIGGTDSGFTLSYWLYVSTTSTYNNESIFMLSNHATVPDAYDQNALVTVLANQGVGTSFNIRIHNNAGGSATTGSVTYTSGSWIKLEYQYRANGTSTVNVYNSSNTLQESLSIGSTPNIGVQYFYWGEVGRDAQATIRAFYLDDIQYNSTNP